MEEPSDAKLETVFIIWCDAIKKPNGSGIFPFDAFKEGFNQGIIFASQQGNTRRPPIARQVTGNR